MDLVHARYAGLDVHKKTVVACVRVAEATGIYWNPVWAVLATEELTLVLAHAAAVRRCGGARGGRATCRTRIGWPICWPMGRCGRVSCRRRRSRPYGI
jgi:hypothetical protein